MILAAGLTPAWQQILQVDGLRVGEVNRASQVRWCPSGKTVNVAIALTRLGADCRLLAPIGGNARDAIAERLARLQVPARLIESSSPTRVCTTLVDTTAGLVTELVENAHPLDPACVQQFQAAYAQESAQADVVVLSGSLPAGTPAGFYAALIKQAALSGSRARVLVDARGAEVLATLPERPLLVKPNRDELASSLGRKLADEQEVLAAMREINRRGAGWVVVTHGKQPVLATSDSSAWRLQPLTVAHPVNPIGCGDCLAAATAWALEQELDMIAALKIGLAAAAQNAATLMPAELDSRGCLADAARVRVEQI